MEHRPSTEKLVPEDSNLSNSGSGSGSGSGSSICSRSFQ